MPSPLPTPRRTRADTFARALAVVLVIAWVIAGGWLVVAPDDEAKLWVTELLPPVLQLIAAVLILLAASRSRTWRGAIAWGLIGVGTLVFALADILFAWYDLGLQVDPFPTLADVAYVAYYPVIVAALLAFPPVAADRRGRARLIIDLGIVLVGGGMLIWQTTLRSTLDALDGDVVATILSIGYPIGDLVLLFGVASIALRRPRGVDAHALVALVIGLGLVLAADVGYALLGVDFTFGWPDLLYMASPVVIGVAGALQLAFHERAGSNDAGTEIPRLLVYLPYGALVAGFGTLVVATAMDDRGVAALVAGATLLTIGVLVRQELVLRENSRLLALEARRETERRFSSMASNSSDAIVLVDANGMVTGSTDSMRRVLGIDGDALVGRSISRLAHADDVRSLAALIADAAVGTPGRARLEWQIWDGTGAWRQVETIAANMLDDPAVGQIVLTTRDVRERQLFEQRLSQVAMHDVLTGLPNRALLLDRIERALAVADRGGTAVLVANLDGFRRLNDSIGDHAGDWVLQEVGRRIESTLQSADTCARIGGDEFGVLIGGVTSTVEGRLVADRIVAALRDPVVVAGTPVHVTGRIGIVVADGGAMTPTTLLRDASVAMTHARTDSKSGIAVFEPAMRSELRGRFELEADLHGAAARGELMLQFQPIHDLATGDLVAAEALVRWNHPTHGRISPADFIPLAEETGLIDEVGTWVLRTSCEEVAIWARIAHGRVPRVAVNLSPHQVADADLPWTIQDALGHAGATPDWLSLEVTEGLLMEDTPAVLARLHAIRSLGIGIAIDDFGTGYSSLAYLQSFPTSSIKIDRSFVIPLDDPAFDPGIVRAVIEIGRAVGMSTVAEGIETATQLRQLQDLGCTFGQGYLLARPLDAAVMRQRIANPPEAAWARAVAGGEGRRRRPPGRVA
jgi:diguanylate cyclase (GGDEF)-like protein/PAS domain S-box-containing protein